MIFGKIREQYDRGCYKSDEDEGTAWKEFQFLNKIIILQNYKGKINSTYNEIGSKY